MGMNAKRRLKKGIETNKGERKAMFRASPWFSLVCFLLLLLQDAPCTLLPTFDVLWFCFFE